MSPGRIAVASGLVFLLAAGFAATGDAVVPAQIDFFYSPGCRECEEVKRDVLPELEARFGGRYVLVPHDMNETATIPLLLAYQEQSGHTNDNGRVSMVIDHTVFLSGYDVIATGLCDRVSEALARRQQADRTPPLPPRMTDAEARNRVERRAGSMTLLAVLSGGATDGFNPCALSTLIFFLSVLTAARASSRTRLVVGIAFIAASFTVYLGLGFGFLLAFRELPHFSQLRRIVEIALGLSLLPLAFLSFRDAVRFHRTQRPESVTLQLPGRMKSAIHRWSQTRVGIGGPLLGGLIVGAGVTLLESVCTGQGYLPVLACILKADCTRTHELVLLIIYNLLFILPLSIVFVCYHRGSQLGVLIAWSRRNLVAAKIALGLFFLMMAVFLLRGFSI